MLESSGPMGLPGGAGPLAETLWLQATKLKTSSLPLTITHSQQPLLHQATDLLHRDACPTPSIQMTGENQTLDD